MTIVARFLRWWHGKAEIIPKGEIHGHGKAPTKQPPPPRRTQ